MAGRGRGQSYSEVSHAIREMLRAHSEASQSLARRLGLGITDATALDHLLSSENGLGPGELSRRLGIRSASATTLVDRLESTGHARRVPHPTDRRRQTVIATDQAYDEVLDALAPLFHRVEQAASRLTPDQAAATATFLRETAEAMRDYAAGPTRDAAGSTRDAAGGPVRDPGRGATEARGAGPVRDAVGEATRGTADELAPDPAAEAMRESAAEPARDHSAEGR
ncbi:MarR family transcriptional regulator [Actinoplanes sp. NPDC049316]|uniref:MarR family winged helix-turn-helix transcriptional regulator n=1 Tax=Actinoplanes sp. NPDC049316 TaxID=3154727 RepID=UPI00343AC078